MFGKNSQSVIPTSIIDRILVNERLLNVITDAGALYMGDNPSTHCPIYVKIDAGTIPKNSEHIEKPMKKPVWYKASSEQINVYTFTLSEKIENIPEPDCLKCSNCNCNDRSHSMDKDSYFMDILCTIIETSHLTIPLTSGREKLFGWHYPQGLIT